MKTFYYYNMQQCCNSIVDPQLRITVTIIIWLWAQINLKRMIINTVDTKYIEELQQQSYNTDSFTFLARDTMLHLIYWYFYVYMYNGVGFSGASHVLLNSWLILKFILCGISVISYQPVTGSTKVMEMKMVQFQQHARNGWTL